MSTNPHMAALQNRMESRRAEINIPLKKWTKSVMQSSTRASRCYGQMSTKVWTSNVALLYCIYSHDGIKRYPQKPQKSILSVLYSSCPALCDFMHSFFSTHKTYSPLSWIGGGLYKWNRNLCDCHVQPHKSYILYIRSVLGVLSSDKQPFCLHTRTSN